MGNPNPYERPQQPPADAPQQQPNQQQQQANLSNEAWSNASGSKAQAWAQADAASASSPLQLNSDGSYTVQFGDCLSQIAARQIKQGGDSATSEAIKNEEQAIIQANQKYADKLQNQPREMQVGWQLFVPPYKTQDGQHVGASKVPHGGNYYDTAQTPGYYGNQPDLYNMGGKSATNGGAGAGGPDLYGFSGNASHDAPTQPKHHQGDQQPAPRPQPPAEQAPPPQRQPVEAQPQPPQRPVEAPPPPPQPQPQEYQPNYSYAYPQQYQQYQPQQYQQYPPQGYYNNPNQYQYQQNPLVTGLEVAGGVAGIAGLIGLFGGGNHYYNGGGGYRGHYYGHRR